MVEVKNLCKDMTEEIILRSSVKPNLMRKTLWLGTWFGGVGALIILTSGVFISPSILDKWGLPIFLGAMSIITLGLLPYKRLKRLELNPYKIVIGPNKVLHFYVKEKSIFQISLSQIDQMTYEDKEFKYGIHLHLKGKKGTSTYFLPFFSQRAYYTLKEVYKPD